MLLQVGMSAPCQQYLQSSWAVCSNSVRLGTGQGSVQVKLPKPSAIANFTASPGSITSSDNPARLSPISLGTSSALTLQVAFDDGVLRDFSQDSRVTYGLAAGSNLCQIVKGAHAGPFEVAMSPPAGTGRAIPPTASMEPGSELLPVHSEMELRVAAQWTVDGACVPSLCTVTIRT